MKSVVLLLTVLLSGLNLAFNQTINIHSVSCARQIEGDNGYTLDGSHMVLSRFKLLNPFNFSDTGIYKKSINLYSSYFMSGSLEEISKANPDIFFFGSFISANSSFIPFTLSEVDSLYQWSVKGGKMIIAEQGMPDSDFENIGYKWGYDIVNNNPSDIIPTAKGKATKLFNGPFGEVTIAKQGGSAQGYFARLNKDNTVLARDASGRPTLYVDCKTMDLICADIDVFTELGGLSVSYGIENDQDKLWANLIAFMDSIDDSRPNSEILYDGTELNTGNFHSYQWFYNLDSISGADSSSIIPQQEGLYRVLVTNSVGCADTSEPFMIGEILYPVISCQPDIEIPTNRNVNYASIPLELPEVIDGYGIASITNNAPSVFPVGTTEITWTATNNAGYSSVCTQKVTVFDNEKPRITCNNEIIVNTDPGKNYAIFIPEPPVTSDNVFVFSVENNAPDTLLMGTNRITWIVSDSSGNSQECTQSIKVIDQEPPIIICNDDTVISTIYGNDYAYLTLEAPVVSDNDQVTSKTNNSNGFFYTGTNAIIWTAVDKSGNISNCQQSVIVQENSELFIPNIITPNNDGKNECLIIDGLPLNCELVIFDKSDNILFKNTNYNNNWCGKNMDDKQIESGTYWYVLKLPQGISYSGFIIIKNE